MKIAEALIERKRIQQFMEQSKERVMSQSKVYEGDDTVDDVSELINNIIESSGSFRSLTQAINKTNQQTIVRDSKSISDLIAEKDALQFTRSKLQQIYKTASEKVERYRSADTKVITTVDLVELRSVIDLQTAQINDLNVELQRYNWTYDLIV